MVRNILHRILLDKNSKPFINKYLSFLVMAFVLTFGSTLSIQAQSYCTPTNGGQSTYQTISVTTTGGVSNINNPNNGYGTGGYNDFTNMAVSIEPGTSFTVNATAYGSCHWKIWIDWNNNFSFNDLGEEVYSQTTYVGDITVTIPVPAAATPGPHRMRITSTWLNDIGDACWTNNYAEIEDYTVDVIQLEDCDGTPNGGVAAQSSISVCEGVAFPLSVTGYSTLAYGLNGVWQSAPHGTDNWTDVPGSENQPNFTANGITSDRDYRYVVYCEFSDEYGYSNIIVVSVDCEGNSPGCPELIITGNNVTFQGDSIFIDCGGENAQLSADYLKTGGTDSYEVQQILYIPPFDYTGGSGSTSINSDDVWSQVIELGFDFCFFENTYNKALVGSNSVITFSILNQVPNGRYSPGAGSGWSFSNSIPSNSTGTSLPYVDAIMGVLQDTYPSNSYFSDWEINYQVLGSAPCRQLVVNFYKLGQFSCGSGVGPQTYQMVIYETTNAIDVYVEDRTPCTSWNGGNGLLGIQNSNGSVAYTPPGRNTGTWSAHEEAWRFIPKGEPNYEFGWYDEDNNLISSEDFVELGPGTYIARIVYHSCYGLDIVDEQTIHIVSSSGINMSAMEDLTICTENPNQETGHFDLTINGENSIGNNDPSDYSISYYDSEDNANAGGTTGQLAIPYNNYQNTSNPQTVWVRVSTVENPACFDVGSFQLIVTPPPTVDAVNNIVVCEGDDVPDINFTGTAGATFDWENSNTLIGLVANGTGDISTFFGESSGSGPEVATITVTPTIDGCDGIPETFTISITPTPTAEISGTTEVCEGNTEPTITFTGTGGVTPYIFTYLDPNGNTQTVESDDNGIGTINAPTASEGVYTYELTAVSSSGNCENPQTGTVTVTVTSLTTGTIMGTTAVCEGAPAPEVVFSGSNGTAPYTFTYNGPDGNGQTIISDADGGATISVPTITPGVYEYELVSVQGTGTIACETPQQENVVVTVNSTPNINAGEDLSVCQGATITLSGSGAGIGGVYEWDQGVTNGVSFAPDLGTHTYTVVGTDANGCFGTDEIVVTVNSISEVVISSGGPEDLFGCAPHTAHLIGSPDTDVSCVWNFSDGSTITSCGEIDKTFNLPGCYDVTLTVTTPEGCISSLTYNDYICVAPNPISNFDANPQYITNLNTELSFINNSSGAVIFEWDFDDDGTSNEFEPNHQFPSDEDGFYNVQLVVTSEVGCTDTSYMIVEMVEDALYFVPNTFTPDQDDFNEVFKPIFVSGFDPSTYHLIIYNRWGETMFESYDSDYGWSGTYGDRIAPQGTYIWKIRFKQKKKDKNIEIMGHVTLIK